MFFKFARHLSRVVRGILRFNMATKGVAFAALAALLYFWFGLSLIFSLIVVFAVYLATGGHKFVRIVIKTFPRDITALIVLLKAKRHMKQYAASGETIPTLFQKTLRKHPKKVAFIMVDGKEYTFRDVDEISNQVANYFYEAGYRKGDTVAVIMENSPMYVCVWLGLSKIGVIPALINFNLKMDSLSHCINIAESKAIVYGSELASQIGEAQHLLDTSVELFCYGDYDPNAVSRSKHLDPLLQRSSNFPPPRDHNTKFNEKLFYIYTSGTTGMPKAAIVIHSRFFYMAYSIHHFFKMNENDVLYDILPLYHTAGGVLGVGQALLLGCTVVIRKKFSASRFWDDCVKYNATATQYIGEIARYLLAQPKRPVEQQHRVRTAFGNGLRPQIWKEYMERFGITRIGEFYGATEGNANIVNNDNTVGAVGFLSVLGGKIYPVTLIKVNEEGEPIRGRDGLCMHCKAGETGELVGKIIKGDPLREFDGYADKKATSKKIAYDVFSKGDSAFLTGDILEMDKLGYLFFRDRTGDTFRWKGENVSTSEVEAVIMNIVELNGACVYGVEIPGIEGRAGMAAIVDEEGKINLKQLYKDSQKALPAYARPVFIRILKELDTTGTFKLKKTDYRKAGFDPSQTTDKMFYLDAKQADYLPIDKQVYENICAGKIRV